MKIVFKLLYNSFFNVLSFIIPKDKKRIIVGGWFGNRFGDNSRYFYILNFHNSLGYKIVYVSDDENLIEELNEKGYYALKKKSLSSVWNHLRSKYHAIDQSTEDILSSLSSRAVRIQMWHGIPIKKIWTEVPVYQEGIKKKLYNAGYLIKGKWNVYHLVVPSEYSKTIFNQCIRNDNIKMILCKYPRVEYLLSNNTFELEEEKINIEKIMNQKEKGKKILFYLPTFRDNNQTLLFGCKNEEEINLFLNKLEELNVFVVAKYHAAEKKGVQLQHRNCLFLPPNNDVYVIYKYSDMLVTDYSSAMFDYLGLEQSILYYPYDYDYYISRDRGLLLDYEMFTPGLKAYTPNQLVDIIRNENNNLYKDKQKKLFNLLYDETYPSLLEVLNKGEL